nr:hypothetical protein [Chlamydiota bacterium]
MVRLTSIPLKEVPHLQITTKGPSISDIKTNRSAMKSFAEIAFAIGAIAFIASSNFATLFIALPCFVITGALVWQIQRMNNYDNPILLAQYRTQAAQSTLQETIKEHGWENMMNYDIPQKTLFPQKFKEAAEKMAIPEIINLYRFAIRMKHQHRSVGLRIPEPKEFLPIFKKEIENLTACEMLEKYNVDQLHFYDLIPTELKDEKPQFDKIVQNRLDKLEPIKKNLRNTLMKCLDAFNSILEAVVVQDTKQMTIITRLKNEIKFLSKNTLTHWFNGSLAIMNEKFEGTWAEELPYIADAIEQFRTLASTAKIASDAEIETIDCVYFQEC